MALVKSTGDLIGLLLILRSVCAQNNGAVKVDEEFQNLNTLHSAVGFKQQKNISNAKFAKQVVDRYESAIFTCGKFSFGLEVYEKVFSTYPSDTGFPITIIEYLQLPKDKQSPIDDLVQQRTVARLIMKNSLNTRLEKHLVTAFSTGDNNCYPNTFSDALSLLSTFVQTGRETSTEDAVLSYHEADTENDIIDTDDSHEDDVDNSGTINDTMNDDIKEIETETSITRTVAFEVDVMATIIAEATADEGEDQFFGASFDQLQEVEDAYEADEPDVVCSTHVIDDEPDIVCGAHIIDVEPSSKDVPIPNVSSKDVPIPNERRYPNPHRDFEMILYHTAQRVSNKRDVFTVNYDSNDPGLISYQYESPCAESVIDYSDAIRLKLKLSGIHDSTGHIAVFEGRTHAESSAVFKRQLNDVDQLGLKTSTIRLLEEETLRHLAHVNYLPSVQSMLGIQFRLGPV
jgi:hypothetical protein